MNLNRQNIKKILFIVVVSIAVFLAMQRIDVVMQFLGVCFRLLTPLVIGLCMAFILNVLLKVWEENVFFFLNRRKGKIWLRIRRGVCLALTYGTVVGLILILVFLIVPEISRSFEMLVKNIPVYIEELQKWADDVAAWLNLSPQEVEKLQIDWDQAITALQGFFSDGSTLFFDTTVGITSAIFNGIFNFIMGIAFSVYMLAQKEKLCRQLKKVALAFLPRSKAEYLISAGKLSNKIFARFVTGQLTEAVIIGVLCFLGMSVFSMPYAALISTIVGCTALIPIFGAFIGTAVGAFLLLMIDPMTALWFVVFIIVLQQIEGNVIYPRVVGSSIGLPGIWVLFAVLVGGGVFGVLGMLVGIPIASVAYCLFKDAVAWRLRKKKISEAQLAEAGHAPPLMDLPPEEHSLEDQTLQNIPSFEESEDKEEE